MQTPYNYLLRKVDGRVRTVLCFRVCLFFKNGLKANQTGVRQFYDDCIHRYSEQFKYYVLGQSGVWQRMQYDTLSMLPFWIDNPDKKAAVSSLLLESTSKTDSLSELAFEYYEVKDEYGYVQLFLPYHHAAGDELYVHACALLNRFTGANILYGTGGYVLRTFPGTNLENDEELGNLLEKYPGIEVDLEDWAEYIQEGFIHSVNWLTVIGDALREKLPDFDGMLSSNTQHAHKTALTAQAINDFIIFRAGTEPSLCGDDKKEARQAYRTLYHELKDGFVKDHEFADDEKIAGNYSMIKWIKRFS